MLNVDALDLHAGGVEREIKSFEVSTQSKVIFVHAYTYSTGIAAPGRIDSASTRPSRIPHIRRLSSSLRQVGFRLSSAGIPPAIRFNDFNYCVEVFLKARLERTYIPSPYVVRYSVRKKLQDSTLLIRLLYSLHY